MLFRVTPSAKLEGKLAPNAKLDRAELVFDGDFFGPESIAHRNDEIYTGVNEGWILRIKNDGKIERVVQTGKPCGKCGSILPKKSHLVSYFSPSACFIILIVFSWPLGA